MWARVGVQCTAAVPPSWSPVCWPHTRKTSLGLAALCCCPTAVFSWSLSLPTAPRSPLLDRGPWACGAEPFQWKRHFEWGACASGPPQAAVCSAGAHGCRDLPRLQPAARAHTGVGTSPDCSLRCGHTRVAAAPHARAVNLAGPRPLTPLRAAWESSCPRCPPALGALVISRGPSGGREAYFSSDVWWGPLSRLGESPE